MPEVTKKTGATPIVTNSMSGQGVQRVAELKTVMVEYRDGHGEQFVKMAFLAPNGDLYFINENAITKRAQTWVAKGVMEKLNLEPVGASTEPSGD